MLRFVSVALLLLLAVALPAVAATTLSGSAPWSVEHVVLGSTTDWDIATAPVWARQCVIKNEHASGVLALGRYDETGPADLADPTSDEFVTIAAGAALTIPLSSGSPTPDTLHRAIPLASTTASLAVGIFCTASAE